MAQGSTSRPATASEVVSIIGQQDDITIARIVATGATTAEVTEAFTWMNADDYMGEAVGRPSQGRVGQVLAILQDQMSSMDD